MVVSDIRTVRMPGSRSRQVSPFGAMALLCAGMDIACFWAGSLVLLAGRGAFVSCLLRVFQLASV
jgi:hypothetical protein